MCINLYALYSRQSQGLLDESGILSSTFSQLGAEEDLYQD